MDWNQIDVATRESMPKLSRRASKKAKAQRMQEEMHKFKHGTLHSGRKRGPIVKSREQAQAIALSESGQSRRKPVRGRRMKGRFGDQMHKGRKRAARKRAAKR